LLSFLPALIGALLLIAIGWWIAGILGRLVESSLNRIGFEHAAERTGISGFLSRTGSSPLRASHVVGQLAKWFVRLIFLELAAQALHLSAVTTLLNSIVLFIPNLVVALVIVLVGLLAAQFVARLIRGSASRAGMSNGNILGAVAEYGIIGLAVVTALGQIGVATIIVTILFAGVAGALALAAGLAFGLGGRDTAAEIWDRSYASSQQAARRLGQVSEPRTGGNGGPGGGRSSSGGGGGVRVPAAPAQPMMPRSTSMSGPEWRTLVTVKLREARAALPDTDEARRFSRIIDDTISRLQRPAATRSDISHQPVL
jgi:hypothetical protein